VMLGDDDLGSQAALIVLQAERSVHKFA
jgi:hypothetical protein